MAAASKDMKKHRTFLVTALCTLAALLSGAHDALGQGEYVPESVTITDPGAADASATLEIENLVNDGAATIDVETLVGDHATLNSLQDWAPLFRLHLYFDSEAPAPRILEWLEMRILGTVEQHHILEFGIFKEAHTPDSFNGVLDEGDQLLYTWTPDGDPIDNADAGGYIGSGSSQNPRGDFRYVWYLIGNQTYDLLPSDPNAGPQWYIGNCDPNYDGTVTYWRNSGPGGDGNSYIVALRTSEEWGYGIILGPVHVPNGWCDGRAARMWPFPTAPSGGAADTYSPNFWSGTGCGDDFYSGRYTSFDAIGVQLVINGLLGLDVGSFDPDVNGDGVADALDIQFVINAVLGLLPSIDPGGDVHADR